MLLSEHAQHRELYSLSRREKMMMLRECVCATGMQKVHDAEAADSSFNDMSYWRTPLPMVDFE